jgi:hypothetical protein
LQKKKGKAKIISSAGGVILSGHNGRITVDNTLDARLEIAKEEVKIRKARYCILMLVCIDAASNPCSFIRSFP